ncbi:MAG: MFS transporter [Candidatus Heimdallarchaeota archaeon]
MNDENLVRLNSLDLSVFFFLHFAVAVFIIAMGSVVPFELNIAGWSSVAIAILFGFITLMELGRIAFAQLVDRKGLQYSAPVYLSGITLLTIGCAMLTLNQIRGQFLVLISLFAASLGAAIVTTTIDGLFAKLSRGKDLQLSMLLQGGRLLGFAVGGITIAAFFEHGGSQLIFLLITMITFVVAVFGALSIVRLVIRLSQDLKRTSATIHQPILNRGLGMTSRRDLWLFMLFFAFYGIGFFAQDSVLEVFGREELSFGRAEIGRITGVWGTATLAGVLLGGYLLRMSSDKPIVLVNSVIAAAGITLLALIPLVKNIEPFILVMIAVFLLGFGGGAVSTPAIARLIRYSRKSPYPLTIMGLFGIAATLVRSGASFLAAVILSLFTFEMLFLFEAACLLVAIVPYIVSTTIDWTPTKSNSPY